MEEWDIEQAVKSVQNGNNHAFEMVVNKYQERIRRYVRYIAPYNREIDDMVQEVFIKIFTQISKYQLGTNFEAWIYKIAYHETMTWLRKQSKQETLLTHEMPESIHYDTYSVEASREIFETLQKLSADERAILFLRVYEELRYSEIAKILKVPEWMLRKRFERAKQKFSKFYKEVSDCDETGLQCAN